MPLPTKQHQNHIERKSPARSTGNSDAQTPVEEPPSTPSEPPVEEPEMPPEGPLPPQRPPVEEPMDVPPESPVREPPPEDPNRISRHPPARHALGCAERPPIRWARVLSTAWQKTGVLFVVPDTLSDAGQSADRTTVGESDRQHLRSISSVLETVSSQKKFRRAEWDRGWLNG
jgi:hypothetical protein